jgi:hypothetical protein
VQASAANSAEEYYSAEDRALRNIPLLPRPWLIFECKIHVLRQIFLGRYVDVVIQLPKYCFYILNTKVKNKQTNLEKETPVTTSIT